MASYFFLLTRCFDTLFIYKTVNTPLTSFKGKKILKSDQIKNIFLNESDFLLYTMIIQYYHNM